MSRDWTEEEIIMLIELVQGYPNIWNPENQAYKNKNKRNDAFTKVAEAMGMPKEEIERKWKVVQSQFRREHGKTMTKSGQGANESYVPQWFGYKYLMYLKDRNMPKHTRDSQETVQELVNTQDEDGNTSLENPSMTSQSENLQEPSETEKPILKSTKKKQVKEKLHCSVSRKRSNPSDPQIEEAFQAIKGLTESRRRRDNFEVYGEHVANKLRSYNPFIRAEVEHKINCILHDADIKSLYQSEQQFTPRTTLTPLTSVLSTASSSSYSSPAQSPYSSLNLQQVIRHQDDTQEDSFINAIIEAQNITKDV